MGNTRVVYVGLSEDVYALGGQSLWEMADPSDYVSYLCDAPGVTGLLWREVKRMVRWACRAERGRGRLTENQVYALEAYLLGNDDLEIAERLGISRQSAREYRLIALKKIGRYKPRERGLFTSMLETFSWREIREYSADMFEEWQKGG